MDGEQYGRGGEEFLGDLKSLEGLSQALVEGAGQLVKLSFWSVHLQLRSQPLSQRLEMELSCRVELKTYKSFKWKTADFSTAAQMAQTIERRLLEAFLVMNVRNAERVTAEVSD